MAQVPEATLAWLHNVLHAYHDRQRTYSDVVRALSHSSLNPRTEVYTYENGASALLLTLSGTLPSEFRGNIYRYPIKIWVPQAYPQEPPTVHVVPARDMLVRPGQHVSVDGRVYHPYLRDWVSMWDRASIAELLEFLQQVFAKEPPVISKAQQQQYRQQPVNQQPVAGAGAVPPRLPPKQRLGSPALAEMPSSTTPEPPPRPPKPGDEYAESFPKRTSSRNIAVDGPPLPPLPPSEPVRRDDASSHPRSTYPDPARHPGQPRSISSVSHPNGKPSGPPLPPLPPQSQGQGEFAQTQPSMSPVSPVSPVNGFMSSIQKRYSMPPPLPFEQRPPPQQRHQYPPEPVQTIPPQQNLPPSDIYRSAPRSVGAPQRPPAQVWSPQPASVMVPAKSQPPLDLLSDPFDVALPTPTSQQPAAPAPPIPPNPEKEHLLNLLSATLTQTAQNKVSQTLAAFTPLQAQHSALLTAQQTLQREIALLTSLSSTLDSNERILRGSIADCDKLISQARTKPQPNIDELLVAPTLVAQQLWTLCAEIAAGKEAMYVLQKALDRGRVGGGEFVRVMRGLGREVFVKMVLARKCARGLGLEIRGGGGGY